MSMKKILYSILAFSIGLFLALILLKASQYYLELYAKLNMIKNTIKISHHKYNSIHVAAYIYIVHDRSLPGNTCMKDIFATIYHGDINTLPPLYGRINIPQRIGFIGKINICQDVDYDKLLSIKWGDNNVIFRIDDIVTAVKIESIISDQ